MISNETDPRFRPSPILTIVLAIMILLIATRASAQSPLTGEPLLDHAPVHPALPVAFESEPEPCPTVVPAFSIKQVKPVMVEMNPVLANLDSDPQADGYRVELVLRDADGLPVAMRSHARFELVPRVPLADRNRLTFADVRPIVWSQPLEFDERAIATVRLPFRDKLRPVFGWPSAIGPERLSTSPHRRGSVSELPGWRSGLGRTGRGRLGRDLTAAGWNDQNHLGLPSVGLMKVRVSVPTAGVYESTSLVRLRPPYGPVDFRWVGP